MQYAEKQQSDIAFVAGYLEDSLKRKLRHHEVLTLVRANGETLKEIADTIRAWEQV